MYYTWTWWWWFAWLIPIFVILWAAFGWGSRRYGGYGYRYPFARDADWNGAWGPTRRASGQRYRNLGPRNYRRSDDRILEDVSDRLMVDDDVDARAMEVRVEDGEVFLTGTVASRFEKRLAEQLADSVAGVRDVQNRLRIGKVIPPASSEHTAGLGAPSPSTSS